MRNKLILTVNQSQEASLAEDDISDILAMQIEDLIAETEAELDRDLDDEEREAIIEDFLSELDEGEEGIEELDIVEEQPEILKANAQPRSRVTGKFKYFGAGTGKGPVHELAQSGFLNVTEKHKELGIDAKKQKEEGKDIPDWVTDVTKWNKAVEAASNTGHTDEYSYVTAIYQNMGGVVSQPSINTPVEIESLSVNELAELLENCGGEGSGVPGPCPAGGGGGGSSGDDDKGKGDGGAGKVSHTPKGAASLSKKADAATKKIQDIKEKASSNSDADDAIKVSAAARTASDKKEMGAAKRYHKQAAELHTKAAEKEDSLGYKEAATAHREAAKVQQEAYEYREKLSNNATNTNNSKGDNSMSFDRKETVKWLTANCDCWKEADAQKVLNSMSDEKLKGLKQVYDNAGKFTVIVNTVAKNRKKANNQGEDGEVAGVDIGGLADFLGVVADPKSDPVGFVAELKGKLDEVMVKLSAAEPPPAEEEMPAEEAVVATSRNQEEEEEEEEKPAMNRKRRLSLKEWEDTMPQEAKSIWNSAKETVRAKKVAIVKKLTANVTDPAKRKAKIAKYMKMEINDLNDLLELIPTNNRDSRTQEEEYPEFHYEGLAGAAVTNANSSNSDDVLPMPWEHDS